MSKYDAEFIRMARDFERLPVRNHIESFVHLLANMIDCSPVSIVQSEKIRDYIQNLSWVLNPNHFVRFIMHHRDTTTAENTRNKDFYNRRNLSLLGKFVESEDFWYPICMKYPEYLKYYASADEVFKTAIRIMV